MSAAGGMVLDLLAECAVRGIRLSAAEGNGLAIDAPRDALDPALLDRLRDHKHELLDALRAQAAAGAVLHDAPEPAARQRPPRQPCGEHAPSGPTVAPGSNGPESGSELPNVGRVPLDVPRHRDRIEPEPLRLDAEGWPLDLTDRDGRPLTLVDPPVADCACGRMVCPWCDLRGRWRCLACDPPRLTG